MPTDRVSFDESQIDALFAAIDSCRLPGAAVGVAIDGKPVYRKAFGLACMELPVALGSSTRIRIASISKQFACLAYMLLCEEGKAKIEDPIDRYLPELHPVAGRVTLRQLMTHVSGLRDTHDIRYQFSGTERIISLIDLVTPYQTIDDVNFAPGTSWSYNNGGYSMLSLAVERICDQPLEDVLRERIFEPIGLYDTLLRRWDTDFLPNSATMHMTDERGRFVRSYTNKEHAGEGGIVSTVDDMLRWLAHMDTPKVGTAETWRTIKTPQTLANGTCTGYGLGLMSGCYRGVGTLSHSGGLMGCNSHMVKVPAAGLDIIILVNRHDVMAMPLACRILDTCLPRLETARAASKRVLPQTTFRSYKSGRVIQTLVHDDRQVVSLDGADYLVDVDDDGTLHLTSKQSVQLVDYSEAPRALQLNDYGNVDEFVAMEPAPTPDISKLSGCYRSDSTGAEIEILPGGARLVTGGQFGSASYRLECLGQGVWRTRSLSSMPWGGILSFADDLQGFRYFTGRTRALAFHRVEGGTRSANHV